MTSDNEVLIISFSRTPLGGFKKSFTNVSGVDLCGEAIKSAVEKSKVDPTKFGSFIVGNVVSSGIGQNPAKQCAIKGGLAPDISCSLVNKVCCSSLKALTIAAQQIKLGDEDSIVVAGFENCTQASLIKNADGVDLFTYDGLTDFSCGQLMGKLVDDLNAKMNIKREEQDEYAINSFKRSIKAWDDGVFNDIIVPIKVDNSVVTKDENLSRFDESKISKLKPAFDASGSITAANASSLADGAACIVMCSRKFAVENGVEPCAKVIAYADAGCDGKDFALAPIYSTKKLLAKSGFEKDAIDIWEVNEAFASIPLMFAKDFGISMEKINILGGAVSIGHPLGCTGARLVTSLILSLRKVKGKYGVATLCNGGGGATSVLIELLN